MGTKTTEDLLTVYRVADKAQKLEITRLRGEVERLTKPKMFPIMTERGAAPHPLKIPWSIAELAYSVYASPYGSSQSLEQLAEIGGFGPGEMDKFLPGWKEQSSELVQLQADVAAGRRLKELFRRIDWFCSGHRRRENRSGQAAMAFEVGSTMGGQFYAEMYISSTQERDVEHGFPRGLGDTVEEAVSNLMDKVFASPESWAIEGYEALRASGEHSE